MACFNCEVHEKAQDVMVDIIERNLKRMGQLELTLNRLLADGDDHMTACERTMGATHPCTCGANQARRLMAKYTH